MRIVIIGGGASGLMAAVTAAENGAAVTVLECGNKPAKKLYATGNGKCNLTNTDMSAGYYRSADTNLVKKTIERFGYKDTLNFFSGLGLLFKDRNGYIYPSTGQAATVAQLLVRRCQELGVRIKCSTKVLSVQKHKNRFIIKCSSEEKETKKEQEETADIAILAAGSPAGGFGCKVTGAMLASSFGHKIIPLVPALTALKCENTQFFKAASGVRVEAETALCRSKNRQIIAKDTGELQITDYGISGIPVFQISRYAGYAFLQKEEIAAIIDFLPEYDFFTLLEAVKKSRKMYGNRTILETLSLIFHEKLVRGVLLSSGIKENQKLSKLDDSEIKKLLYHFKQFSVKITGTNDIKNSQVCAGGVSTLELTEDFMSKKAENLYIIGETVDVDGICGGYNLQFAWASGHIAGRAASLKK